MTDYICTIYNKLSNNKAVALPGICLSRGYELRLVDDALVIDKITDGTIGQRYRMEALKNGCLGNRIHKALRLIDEDRQLDYWG